MSGEAQRRIVENPFYVLGLRPNATRQEIEREGQKLLGMLELNLAGSGSYATPLGTEERTADKVRLALSELRDPEKRLLHEVWAALEPSMVVDLEDDDPTESRGVLHTWSDARRRLGWGD